MAKKSKVSDIARQRGTSVDEVLAHALVTVPQSIEWTEEDDLASQPGAGVHSSGAAQTAH